MIPHRTCDARAYGGVLAVAHLPVSRGPTTCTVVGFADDLRNSGHRSHLPSDHVSWTSCPREFVVLPLAFPFPELHSRPKCSSLKVSIVQIHRRSKGFLANSAAFVHNLRLWRRSGEGRARRFCRLAAPMTARVADREPRVRFAGRKGGLASHLSCTNPRKLQEVDIQSMSGACAQAGTTTRARHGSEGL